MMKKTICLLFVALIAQICAIPTGTDFEREVKGAEGHAAAAANEAKKDASELAEKAINPDHAKSNAGSQNKSNTGHKNEGNAGHQNEGNAGHHNEGDAGHHAKGAKRGGEGLGPASKMFKNTEEITKKLADKGVKLVTDILGLWKI